VLTVFDVTLQHAFIKNSGKKAIIAALVDECMPTIEEYRQTEVEEQVRCMCSLCKW